MDSSANSMRKRAEQRRRVMPDLAFRVGEPAAMMAAAVPTVAAPLHLTNLQPDQPVQSILLNCQVQIEPLGRPYSAAEEARLLDLFGERERWARTMKPLLWAIQVLKIPAFAQEATVDVMLPCTMDFDVAATKYFYGLEKGSIQISVLFSGTVFYTNERAMLQATQIPWDREARFHLPVETWRRAVEAHYPDAAWLRLPKESFDRLYRFKVARGIPTWDGVIHRLMERAETSANEELPEASMGVKL